MNPDEVKQLIQSGLPDAEVHVEGDGRHFYAVVVCAAFEGKSMLKQHQMVYGTLGNAMAGALHALSMRTYTPEQWQQAKESSSE